jgi:signal transduction histidine kinase
MTFVAEESRSARQGSLLAFHRWSAHRRARERSEQMAERNALLGEMTRGIVHDLRNVLCIVDSGLRSVDRHASHPARLKFVLDGIRDGIERGLDLISQILSFSDARGPALLDEANNLLEKLVPLVRLGAGAGVRVILKLGRNLPSAPVDAAQFNAAILNLIINARDALPEGGTIRISTDEVTATGRAASSDHVRVRIRDNGRGMLPEVSEHVFDRYFTTKGDAGTGLGVPQVHAFVEQAGGFVRVSSVVGAGTTFDLFLPVHKLEPATEACRALEDWANEGGAIGAPMKAASNCG